MKFSHIKFIAFAAELGRAYVLTGIKIHVMESTTACYYLIFFCYSRIARVLNIGIEQRDATNVYYEKHSNYSRGILYVIVARERVQ